MQLLPSWPLDQRSGDGTAGSQMVQRERNPQVPLPNKIGQCAEGGGHPSSQGPVPDFANILPAGHKEKSPV